MTTTSALIPSFVINENSGNFTEFCGDFDVQIYDESSDALQDHLFSEDYYDTGGAAGHGAANMPALFRIAYQSSYPTGIKKFLLECN